MKVIIVAPYFYPVVGGAEVYTINIAKHLKGMGWEVVVVTTGNRKLDLDSIETVEGMRVYRLKVLIKLSNTPIGISWGRELKRIFRAERPDVINAHTPVPYIADMAQRSSEGIPFVLTYHNDLAKDSVPGKALAWLAHYLLINATLRRSDCIIATSEYYVQKSRYLRPHKRKTRVASPGVDVSRFNPDLVVNPELTDRFRGQRVILFVGSLKKSHQHKGVNVLMSAFQRLNRESADTRFVIVGEGSGMEMYRSMAEAAGISSSVYFTGQVEDTELPQYYRLATVFAMPSTNRSEGFGMTYIEANAVGTPVIGSCVGGVPYAVRQNETGILVEPNSVDQLYEALRLILDNADLARKLGQAGSKRVLKEFTWTLSAERTSSILKEFVSCG
jgi:glycosyltransferase involved in cell wall biosynthesis